ncbi:MAG: DUF4362 domain-containing protein [Lachnospiraceae bacterium]|nr:DUF4362 domain-containing protein [Lachnospiraceae bacterium]
MIIRKARYVISILFCCILTACGSRGEISMLENASPENSAMCFYRFDGETTYVKWLYDQTEEKRIIKEINKLPTVSGEPSLLSDWPDTCYGISIRDKDGYDIWLSYGNGIWLVKGGRVYTAEYDLAGLYERIDTEEDWLSKDGSAIPNAAILAKYNANYYGKTGDEDINQSIRMTFLDLDGTVATVRLDNLTETEVTYGEPFTLDKEIDGEWVKLPVAMSNYSFISVANILQTGDSAEAKCDLIMYGELEPGRYRIEKENTYAVFILEADGTAHAVSSESEFDHIDLLDRIYQKKVTKDYQDIRKLADDYNSDRAQTDGCFVVGAMVHNDYTYSEFVSRYERKEDAFIRVAQSTTEGDLILTDVMYDSEHDLVYVITDSTRDQFSAESDRVISVREFDAIAEYTYLGSSFWTAYNGELNDETFESEDAYAIVRIN